MRSGVTNGGRRLRLLPVRKPELEPASVDMPDIGDSAASDAPRKDMAGSVERPGEDTP